MSGTFTNFASLKKAMLSELQDAVYEATKKSYENLKENVSHFYDSPEGRYHRTGQLQDSPTNDGCSSTSNGAIGQISLNTSTQYSPAGRDTEWIYNTAEANRLLGNGGFWKKTESEIQNILDSEVAKRF